MKIKCTFSEASALILMCEYIDCSYCVLEPFCGGDKVGSVVEIIPDDGGNQDAD